MKLNLSDFKREYESYDGKREKLIKQSRVVLKAAKELGYCVHRSNKSECSKYVIALQKEYNALLKIKEGNVKLQFEGSFNEACEEYAENILYFDFVFGEKLRSYEELKVSQDNYIGSLADLTGELGRRCVHLAIKKKYSEIYLIQEFVSSIFKEMLSFNFRNGTLRKKSDSIKWNLNKIEDIIYDIELKGKK